MRNFKNYINQFHSNKLFYKMIVSYTIIACILFCLSSIVTIIGVSSGVIAQVTSSQHKMLENAENTYDSMLKSVSYISTDVFDDRTTIDALTQPYSTDTSLAVSDIVSYMKNSSNIIDKVYFFNLKNNVIYTGETPFYTVENFPDQNLISLISKGKDVYTSYLPYALKYENDFSRYETKKMLISVYKFNDQSSMAVCISSEKLDELINTNSLSANQKMTVLNSDGIVLSSYSELFGKDLSEVDMYKKLLNTNSAFGTVKHFPKIYCFRKSNILNSLYVCELSFSDIIGSFKLQFLIIFLFTLLLICMFLITSIKISVSVFRPFKKLRQNIFDILGYTPAKDIENEGTDDDLFLISKNLQEIKKGYDSMQDTEQMYSLSKRNELTYNILIGAFNFDPSILPEYGMSFPYKYFSVMVVCIDGAKNTDVSNINLIRYGMANVGAEFMTTDTMNAYSSTFGGEHDILFIINHKDPSPCYEAAQNMQKYAMNIFSQSVSVSYDTFEADEIDIEEIAQLYKNAQEAMRYRITLGHGSIIPYQNIEKHTASDCKYPADIEKELLKSIYQHDMDEVRENINKFIDCISQMPYTYIILNAYMLITTLDLQMKSADDNDSDTSSLSDEIMKVETIDELKEMLLIRCNDAAITTDDLQPDTKHMMIAQSVEDYINNHYTDPNLSIDAIASYINKSANYTRSIFKNSKGISISDYITKKRFGEVCRLLVETNMTAQAISQQTGMSSGSYFYTAFKKYTGYTPEQYRQKYK